MDDGRVESTHEIRFSWRVGVVIIRSAMVTGNTNIFDNISHVWLSCSVNE